MESSSNHSVSYNPSSTTATTNSLDQVSSSEYARSDTTLTSCKIFSRSINFTISNFPSSSCMVMTIDVNVFIFSNHFVKSSFHFTHPKVKVNTLINFLLSSVSYTKSKYTFQNTLVDVLSNFILELFHNLTNSVNTIKRKVLQLLTSNSTSYFIRTNLYPFAEQTKTDNITCTSFILCTGHSFFLTSCKVSETVN